MKCHPNFFMSLLIIFICFTIINIIVAFAIHGIFIINNTFIEECSETRNILSPDIDPKNKNFISMMLSHASNAYSLYCKPNLKNWLPPNCELLLTMENKAGYIIKCAGKMLISFRGTYNFNDIVTDIRVNSVPFYDGNVHQGFLKHYYKYRDDIKKIVAHNYSKILRIYITGHSLGASTAVLCAADLNKTTNKKIDVVVFACPKLANFTFSTQYPKSINLHIVRNSADIIPISPMGLKEKWFDIITAKYFEFRLDYGSWRKNHSIDTYTKGIQFMYNIKEQKNDDVSIQNMPPTINS